MDSFHMHISYFRLFILFITISTSFLPLYEGSCQEVYPIPGMHGCVYLGFFMPLNTTAEIDCVFCECLEDGTLTCCSMVTRFWFPAYCKEVPDGPCRKKVVMKDDPSIPCDKLGGTGK